MRLIVLLLFAFNATAFAQEAPKKKAPKKAKAQQATAHKKPTPEQIRRFNDLEKKQK